MWGDVSVLYVTIGITLDNPGGEAGPASAQHFYMVEVIQMFLCLDICPNAPICKVFHDFCKNEVMQNVDRVRSGALPVIGREGHVEPPLIVLPIEPRRVLDCRYVNLWIIDTPFSLEILADVARRGGGDIAQCQSVRLESERTMVRILVSAIGTCTPR